MKRFRDNERLDERWRSLRLEKAIARIEGKRERLMPALVPDYPEATHTAKRYCDGRGVVIRKKEPPH